MATLLLIKKTHLNDKLCLNPCQNTEFMSIYARLGHSS